MLSKGGGGGPGALTYLSREGECVFQRTLMCLSEDMLGHILQAMGHWEKLTCIRFVNRTTEKDYIEFEPGPCG